MTHIINKKTKITNTTLLPLTLNSNVLIKREGESERQESESGKVSYVIALLWFEAQLMHCRQSNGRAIIHYITAE